MKHKGLRVLIGVITGFIALTAIGGGIALLSGAESERFPLEWLEGSLFENYIVPALLLTIMVGGSSLVACITVFRNLQTGIPWSFVAGIMMTGFIAGEVLILKQVPPGPTLTEKIYFTLGLVTFILAGLLWFTEKGSFVQTR